MLKGKYIILTLTVLACLASQDLLAQRVIRDLESNADLANVPNDTIEGNKKKKQVPVDVVAWNIDPIYGRRTPVDVDTLQHDFQNKAYPEGLHGQINSLGNLGSPRESRIFMERQGQHDFPFITLLDQFIESPENYKYYNTKSPYVNLIVAREDNKDAENVKKFVQAYQSDEVYEAANKIFNGGAVKGW